MKLPVQNQASRTEWRRLSVIFLSLLPLLTIFHLVMWFGFTRTLFRAETGSSKRIGYLVGLEDRQGKLEALEPKDGYTLLAASQVTPDAVTPVVLFGDSFAGHLAKACSRAWHVPVVQAPVIWSRKDGLSEIEGWLKDDWFRKHGVKTVILERVECEWLNTFSDLGDSSLDIPWQHMLTGDLPPMYEKAHMWTFANNGNFKVLFCNFGYLFSPTAFNQTDTCVVSLREKFFNCSYGKTLLFYRGDLTRGVPNAKNRDQVEQALRHLQDVAEVCRQQGMKFYMVVPPNKSYLYRDWVVNPFYPDSPMLKTLQERGTVNGYVDLQKPFHQKLEQGYQDLYYPDDLHWNYPAAEFAAEELAKAGAQP